MFYMNAAMKVAMFYINVAMLSHNYSHLDSDLLEIETLKKHGYVVESSMLRRHIYVLLSNVEIYHFVVAFFVYSKIATHD